MTSTSGPDVEKAGVQPRAVWSSVATVIVIAVLCAAAVALLYPRSFREPPPAVGRFAAPSLETRPAGDYRSWLARQQRRLDGEDGWMPIESAMATIAAKGAGAYDPVEVRQ